MTSLANTVAAKSDQLNNIDLSGGPITIKITGLSKQNSPEQPISVNYEGDKGKPFKPCLTMRRLLLAVWQDNTPENSYIGRLLTLYRDENVTFGPDKTGGTRISHMSNISEPKTVALQYKRGKFKSYTVQPIATITGAAVKPPAQNLPLTDDAIENLKNIGRAEAAKGKDALKAWWSGLGGIKQNQLGAPFLDELKRIAANPEPAPDANEGLQGDEYFGSDE